MVLGSGVLEGNTVKDPERLQPLGLGAKAPSSDSTLTICSFGAMVYSPRTGILLNNELLDLCWRHVEGSAVTPPPGESKAPLEERNEGGWAANPRVGHPRH